jgi:hypothetical protein
MTACIRGQAQSCVSDGSAFLKQKEHDNEKTGINLICGLAYSFIFCCPILGNVRAEVA